MQYKLVPHDWTLGHIPAHARLLASGLAIVVCYLAASYVVIGIHTYFGSIGVIFPQCGQCILPSCSGREVVGIKRAARNMRRQL